MKRKAALALGIAIIAVIVLCLFSCGQEEKPQADSEGTPTASETDESIEDESVEEDPGGDSGSEEADSKKDSQKDDAGASSKTSTNTNTNKKSGTTAGSSKKTSSGTASKTSGKSSASGKTSGSTSGNSSGQGTPTPQNGSGNNSGGTHTDPAPAPTPAPAPQPTPAADPMNWPDNEYTALLPRPSAGKVQKTDMQDGVYCLLLTGADMTDVKAYASALINAGFINEVTETVESGTYLFGGGNSSGSFVVVSYQSGQFIIGVQP